MPTIVAARPKCSSLCRTILLTALLSVGQPASSHADAPLTPLIGVGQTSIDFGTVPMGTSIYINEELLNAVRDSTSVLEITSIDIQGDGFGLYCPPDSLDLPGDSTTVLLPVRFEAASAEEFTGVLTISASNAPNSPLEIPLSASGSSVEHYTCGVNTQDPAPDPDYDYRRWQCTPSVIRDDGQSSFVLEVDLRDVSGVITEVTLRAGPRKSDSMLRWILPTSRRGIDGQAPEVFS